MKTQSTRSSAPRVRSPLAALALALVLGASTQAHAQDVVKKLSPLQFGLMVDVGAPDGLGASVVVRPLRWVRFNAGLMTNTVSFGPRAGVSFTPLSFVVSPSLNVEAGHYFSGDYNTLLERLGGTSEDTTSLIRDVSYSFATGSLGVEIGPASSWHIFLRGGLSYWALRVQNTQEFLRETTGEEDLTATPLHIRFTSPSFKLGFLYYF